MRTFFHGRSRLSAVGQALPLNAFVAGGHTYLRVTTACEVMLHLAPLADEVAVRRRRAAANPRHSRLTPAGGALYDHAALTERCWAERTLCGLTWWEMASHAREVELSIEAAQSNSAGYTCPWCARDAAAPR